VEQEIRVLANDEYQMIQSLILKCEDMFILTNKSFTNLLLPEFV